MTHTPEDQPSSPRVYQHRQLDQIAARWDAKAAHWDADLQDPLCHLNEDNAYQRFLDELGELVRQRFEFCSAHGVIDAGCATGLVLEKVISSFAWGIGIDLSPAMIQAAQAKSIPCAKFVVGDCFNLSALGSKAGAVVSRGVLLSHYGPDNATELLRSARAVLVPGGFTLWDFLNLAGRASSSHTPENKTYYEDLTIVVLARSVGFDNVRVSSGPNRRVGLLLAE